MHLMLLFYTGKNTAELAEEIQQLREKKRNRNRKEWVGSENRN